MRGLAAILLALLVVLPTAAGPAHQPAAATTAEMLVSLVNQERWKAGVPALVLNLTLMAEAQRFSQVQATLVTPGHRGTDGSDAGQRLIRARYAPRFWWGEAIAAGQTTPEQTVADWMASPSHRAILLLPWAMEIGVGYTVRPGSVHTHYWVLEVGLRDQPVLSKQAQQ